MSVERIYFDRIKDLEQENKQLKEELNELLNDPDFGHMKNCGICGKLVSKAIDETSAINVKGSRLTWVCNDCDNLKQKLEKMPDSFIEWQEKCCCDFIEPRNNHEHSLTCKSRFKEILKEKA